MDRTSPRLGTTRLLHGPRRSTAPPTPRRSAALPTASAVTARPADAAPRPTPAAEPWPAPAEAPRPAGRPTPRRRDAADGRRPRPPADGPAAARPKPKKRRRRSAAVRRAGLGGLAPGPRRSSWRSWGWRRFSQRGPQGGRQHQLGPGHTKGSAADELVHDPGRPEPTPRATRPSARRAAGGERRAAAAFGGIGTRAPLGHADGRPASPAASARGPACPAIKVVAKSRASPCSRRPRSASTSAAAA